MNRIKICWWECTQQQLRRYAPKRKRRRCDETTITGCTESYHFDNLKKLSLLCMSDMETPLVKVFMFHLISLVSLCFSQGQFWPSSVVVTCVYRCLCVRVRAYVNPELVRLITYVSFTPASPHLDQRCKTPWLIFLLFQRVIDLHFQGQV